MVHDSHTIRSMIHSIFYSCLSRPGTARDSAGVAGRTARPDGRLSLLHAPSENPGTPTAPPRLKPPPTHKARGVRNPAGNSWELDNSGPFGVPCGDGLQLKRSPSPVAKRHQLLRRSQS
jgi:hypothetical protein